MPTTPAWPSGPMPQHRLPWLCHCISGPAKSSRTGSSVGRALAMYIAPARMRLVAVDRVDERLGLGGVEERVVLDQRQLDVVLAAGARVADRGVAVGDRRSGVGVLRQVLQRRLRSASSHGPPARGSRRQRPRRRSAASDPTAAASCGAGGDGGAVRGVRCAAATRRPPGRPRSAGRRPRRRAIGTEAPSAVCACGCDSSTTRCRRSRHGAWLCTCVPPLSIAGMVIAAIASAGNSMRGDGAVPLADHRRGQRAANSGGGQQRARGVGELRGLANLETCRSTRCR